MYVVEVADQFGVFVQNLLLQWAEFRLIFWRVSL
jgi:hypothetical protein